MKRLVFISLILFFSLSSVFAQRVNKEVPENSLVYALPKTSIEISVEVKKDTYIPGPYVRYADVFLSIENVSVKEDVSYSIGNVSMQPVTEADYEYLYSLPIGEKTTLNATFLSLAAEGLIFAVNEPKKSAIDLSAPLKNFQHYTDRLSSPPIKTRKETINDRIRTDSGFINVPYQESFIEKKDPESKAEDAAKFLFALRQRRFELISGDVEHAFSGNSLKDALKEISRLEKEYLSLFIGKHIVESRVYKFYISPDKALDKKSYAVCYFSEVDGPLSESTRTTKPLLLNVSPSGKVNALEGVKTRIKLPIYYRIPETAFVQLYYGSNELCSGKMHIYQMGKELSIPSDAKLQ
ncbi:MAG: DUF4831 family protein [Prevotellaceae bacterium]|jgi:hypothetical protein|nr:DUF4831 family protein [Prevotellaceae bacterium]